MFTCEERVGPKLCGASTANYPAAAGAVARLGQFAAATIIGIAALAWAAPAAAYRPFDGTDAAVADVGEVEIEFQPLGAAHAGGTTRGLTDAILNYGFADRWELVLQSTPQVAPQGFGPISVSNAALLKYVVQPGVLQEKPGPSIATEFGALLPEFGGSGIGASWAGIMSQRWDWGTVHFNLAANLTPDQHAEVFVDTIIEGPNKWKVRPVAEFYFDNVFNEAQTYSALVGAIWQVNDKLSFDVAVRYALVDGRPVSEFRAGLTFGFPLNFGKPSSAQCRTRR
jgi:hypothetical protein